MKSNKEWLKFLSKEDKKEFMAELKSRNNLFYLNNKSSSFTKFIDEGFVWDKSAKGHLYWNELAFKDMKLVYSREDVIILLKKQIRSVRNTIGRMPHDATDIDILKKLSKIKPIKF